MGAAALPIALGVMGGTSLLQYGMTRSAGRIAKMESETQAKQIELGTVQREADRKEALARAMAAQIAESGAKGIASFEGSPLSILQADIAKEKEATRRDIGQSKIEAMTVRARGSVAKKQAYAQSYLNLIGDVGKTAALSKFA
jgi:hypothetical protein